MKRLFTIGLMLVSAFALTNCAEEITAPVQDDITVDGNIENNTPPEEDVDIPFEVYATVSGEADTKTVNWGNATYWHKYEEDGDAPSDQISVLHHNGKSLTHNKEFTIYDVENGLFKGSLTDVLGATNDWYFIYPYKSDYTVSSSSGSTLTVSGVQIGAKEITNVKANSKEHIAGEYSPMYGSLANLPVRQSPDIDMHHLAAVVAIKVVNKTDGPIIIRDIEFGTPRIVSKDPITSIKTTIEESPILGDCVVTINGGEADVTISTAQGAEVHSTTKVTLINDHTLSSKNDEMTVYVPVCPFSTTGKTISIKINGSQRTLKLDSDVLTSGKVTTFKINVETLKKNITNDLISNVFDDSFYSSGEEGRNWEESRSEYKKNYITYYTYTYKEAGTDPNATHIGGPIVLLGEPISEMTDITINGQPCSKVYKLGNDTVSGTMTISGWAKDIINALPLSFYVSGLSHTPAAMTIKSVNLWIPEYNKAKNDHKKIDIFGNGSTTEYHRLKTRTKLADSNIKTLIDIGASIVDMLKDVKITDQGLTRETLVKFVDPNTITFNGIPTNGHFTNKNAIVLREDVTHKSIVPGLVDYFLKEKFSLDKTKPASYLGLAAIVNASKSDKDGSLTYNSYTDINDIEYTSSQMSEFATMTAEAIYNKILSVLVNRVGSFQLGDVKFPDAILNIVFENPLDLIHKLRDMKFEIVIQTYPYAEQYKTDTPDGAYAPIVLWEMRGTVPSSDSN